MRGHSRWVVAAAAALVLAPACAATARSHHRAYRADRASHATTTPPPAPATGMRPNDAAPPPPVEVANTGRAGLASALGAHDALAILGKNVHSSTGEDMGRLVDVIVDVDGRPRAAIIDFGGFLGVGSRKIAVDWSLLKFVPSDPKGNVITVALTRDQVKAAPEFKEGSPVVALGAANAPPAAPPSAAASPPQAEKK